MRATLTKSEFADRLGISVKTLEREMKLRAVEHYRVRGRVLFAEEQVAKFLNARVVRERPVRPKSVEAGAPRRQALRQTRVVIGRASEWEEYRRRKQARQLKQAARAAQDTERKETISFEGVRAS